MGKFDGIKVDRYNEVQRNNYNNRYSNGNEMENKLNYINKVLPKGYSYRKFDFIVENIGKLNISTIKSLNNYLLKLYSECNMYYYNSDGFFDSICGNLSNVDLEKELVEIYGKDIKIVIKVLYKFFEEEIKLNKDQFNSACSLILYLSIPTHICNIDPNWYTLSSKIYVLESILDILTPLIKFNDENDYSNFFSKALDEIESEYEEKLSEEYGFLDDDNNSNDKVNRYRHENVIIGDTKNNESESAISDCFTEDLFNTSTEESKSSEPVSMWGLDSNLGSDLDSDNDNGNVDKKDSIEKDRHRGRNKNSDEEVNDWMCMDSGSLDEDNMPTREASTSPTQDEVSPDTILESTFTAYKPKRRKRVDMSDIDNLDIDSMFGE